MKPVLAKNAPEAEAVVVVTAVVVVVAVVAVAVAVAIVTVVKQISSHKLSRIQYLARIERALHSLV
jgi:hypothetical protein